MRKRRPIAASQARALLCMVALVALACVLVGCGGSGQASGSAALISTSSSTPASAASTTASTNTPIPKVTSSNTKDGSASGDKEGGSKASDKASKPARSRGVAHRRGRVSPKHSHSKQLARVAPHATASPVKTPSSSANAENGIPYEVHTVAMAPTYKPFSKVYYDPTQVHPQIGQAILFYLPAGAEEGTCASPEVGGRACAVPTPGLSNVMSLARVVGLPGEEIAIRDGLIVRNGQPVSESSIQSCGVKELASEPGCEYPKAITVPPESYYVMADNRQLFQEDSRGFGAVPQAAVIGTLLGS
jgi:signal peptidase I